ncbi:efflux transporter outer membrane subunit [Pseudomonas schmalbachii]|uniref:Efflux transporter outer membrane subunit n=1 Tax=Pseudomonas schmalbachii TaxID=2816993 RepID=A0ABS3TMI5_9PSED|nr:efflux transporter outer membrane subunit [Pseudomonas schmalbachii]MBO3274863.1 efflux transporter outer membrane subunit [Pseudomonas schmalbachii]
MKRRFLWMASALALAGCAGEPEPRVPSVELPAQWRHAAPGEADAVDADWWRRFGSAELDALVERARRDSYDIQAAEARLRQARAAATVAGAALLPTVDGVMRAARQDGPGDAYHDYRVGLEASYEVDFWGRNRALRDAAGQQFRASRFDLDTLRLSLTAAVATAWLERAGLGERLRIAELDLASAERVLATLQSRESAGAAMPLELAQQRALVAGQRVAVASLRQQANESEVALGVLLGVAPQSLQLSGVLPDDLAGPRIDSGMPAQLLGRRPDIARAEAQLAAADADLDAARAALFPRVTLGAGSGFASNHVGDLLNSPLHELSAALLAPIFDGGRLSALRDLSAARRTELLADYRQSIVVALAEVESGLNAVSGFDARLQAQAEQVRQARLAFELADSRYRAGAENLLTLLDAQRTLYAAQDLQAALRQARLQASVALYKALGGGWKEEG